MIELNAWQFQCMTEMAEFNPYQIIVRANAADSEGKAVMFQKTNKDVDGLIAAGMVVDTTANNERPAGIDREYRIVGITPLGRQMFSKSQQGVAQA